ncbi:caspase family protein [Sporosarcina koreensis]|uniref:caspase family protein n=1 Tax=Sporosarcina koreensis TaxID=334735 RepID=UPI0007576F3A|nr:caspase family protein [Sporosarcina koreensis]
MEIKALVVGVSEYSSINQSNLPFCINDINAVKNALVDGLLVEKSNITSLGDDGFVSKSDFLDAVKLINFHLEADDTFIFYFSGHGGNVPSDHYLLFSDGVLKTQDLIQAFDNILAKNKIIILDSCMSGNFKVEETAKLSVDTEIADFFGKGSVVISSSNATQYSYGHPAKPVSLFTSFLCEALKDKLLIKKGKKSLHDIQKLLFLYLDIWNKSNPNHKQNPIFRANLGGTILFPVETYIPYKTKEFYNETENYIIYSVEPTHSSIAKRFSVKIILKRPLSFKEISSINYEIVEKVKREEIYKSEQEEFKWKGLNANIVFCYYGRDETDMTNSNFICHTTWIDETQDKKWWYRKSDKTETIDGVYFNFHSYYTTLKIFQQENIGEEKTLIFQTKEIISQLVTLAEKVINIYNEFLNETKTEQQFIDEMNLLASLIEKWYFAETELTLPPKEIKEWCSACSGLTATIHDFTLFYNEKALATRSFDNRIACMNITKERYYEDLEKLKFEEARMNSLIND